MTATPFEFHNLYIENLVVVSSTALLWFDYALTFTSEVKRIWRRKFTGATVLFLIVRYTALFERPLSVIYRLNTTSGNDSLCSVVDTISNVLDVLYVLAYEATIVLRMYGVSGKGWRLTLLVLPFSLVPVVFTFQGRLATQPPLACAGPWSVGMYIFCWVLGLCLGGVLPIIASVSQAVSIGILISVTLYKTYSIKRDSSRSGARTPLATALIQDGTVFLAIAMFCFFVSMFPALSSSETRTLIETTWPVFYPSLTTIVHSRFLLKLRGLNSSDPCDSLPTIRGFSHIGITTSRVVGDLGATVAVGHEMEESFVGSHADSLDDDESDDAPQFSIDPVSNATA